MKVALLCPYSLSVPGGVQGQVVGMAASLTRMGHDVRVLAPAEDSSHELAERLGIDAERLVLVGSSIPVRGNGSVAPIALSPTASFRALAELAGGGYDVAHLHEPFAPGPNWACVALAGTPLFGTPLIGTFHRAGTDALYRLLAPVARVVARRLRVRCAVSDAAAATAMAIAGGSYEIVGNGIDFARFAEVEPWPADAPTVLFAGRHEQRKGLGVLLDAFAGVQARSRELPGGDEPVLWIAGEGPETSSLRRKAIGLSRVEWLGRVGDLELARRMRGADILCVPSLAGESFGVVLAEGMAAGCLVVASDLPGYRSVLGSHGILVAPGDAGALCDALLAALECVRRGAGLASRSSVAARERWSRQWSMDAICAAYVDVYRRAMAGR